MMADPTGSRTIEVFVRGSSSGLAQEIEVRDHRLRGDEPRELGGTDTGPAPHEFLLAALGSCTSMTVSLYARRKEWPLEEVKVRLRHSRVPASELPGAKTREGMLDRIERQVEFVGPLNDEQKARLIEIANKCPVHRTLTSEIVIETSLGR
jgi:uncharacterized OsmC-like protein